MSSSSRPTTPRRRKSRYSHRSSGVYALLPQSPKIHYPIDPENLPLDSSASIENFEQLSDAVQDLELNMSHLHQIHQSISQGFNESFASFLYGLSITMWCIDFPSTPSKDLEEKLESSKRLDENISDLQERINKAQRQNEILKLKLQSKLRAKQNANVLKAKPVTNRGFGFRGNKADESFSSDSTYGIKSKIPMRYGAQKPAARQPMAGVRKPQRTQAHTSAIPQRTSANPNLNQPPRYLDGLFGSTSSTTRVRKPTRLQDRPPFR